MLIVEALDGVGNATLGCPCESIDLASSACRSVTIRGCVEAAPSCKIYARYSSRTPTCANMRDNEVMRSLPILKARRADVGQRRPQVALEQGDARVRGGVHAARQGSLRRGPTELFWRGCFVNVRCYRNR